MLLPLAGQSPSWALGAMLLMPRLGDYAFAWGRAWQGARFVSRIRGWECLCKDAVAAEIERLREAWRWNAAPDVSSFGREGRGD